LTKPPTFERRETTTVGADPTVVVSYYCKELGLRITEFQGTYLYEIDKGRNAMVGNHLQRMCEALHCALEDAHQYEPYYKAAHEESDRATFPLREAQTEEFREIVRCYACGKVVDCNDSEEDCEGEDTLCFACVRGVNTK
jgi:hypothetical protein